MVTWTMTNTLKVTYFILKTKLLEYKKRKEKMKPIN